MARQDNRALGMMFHSSRIRPPPNPWRPSIARRCSVSSARISRVSSSLRVWPPECGFGTASLLYSDGSVPGPDRASP